MSTGDGINVQLAGGRELRRLLDAVPEKYAKPAIRKGTRAGCKIIQPLAKALAPRGRNKRLPRAIRVRATKRSRNYIGAVVRLGEGFFRGDTFYGAFVELGHYQGKRKGGRKTRQSAHGRKYIEGRHFMERAAEIRGPVAGRVSVLRMKFELEKSLRNRPGRRV